MYGRKGGEAAGLGGQRRGHQSGHACRLACREFVRACVGRWAEKRGCGVRHKGRGRGGAMHGRKDDAEGSDSARAGSRGTKVLGWAHTVVEVGHNGRMSKILNQRRLWDRLGTATPRWGDSRTEIGMLRVGRWRARRRRRPPFAVDELMNFAASERFIKDHVTALPTRLQSHVGMSLWHVHCLLGMTACLGCIPSGNTLFAESVRRNGHIWRHTQGPGGTTADRRRNT